MFSEYLRIGMQLSPDDLRDAAKRATKNVVWKPNTTGTGPADPGTPRVETLILTDPDKTGNTASKLAENFITLDDKIED